MFGKQRIYGRIGLVLAVVVGVVVGATVGQAGMGRAASSAVAPKNTKPPVISGLVEVGQTLTGTVGSWSGNPTSYRRQWSLCDGTGAACLAISGATAKIYTVRDSDAGHTIRLSVTARNSAGSASATSAATAVVPSSGCPGGTGMIAVSQLAPPAELVITSADAVAPVTRSSQQLQMRFTITACNGRPVQGVTVYASPIPYNQFAGEQGLTAADGTVTLTEARRGGYPVSSHQHLLAIYIRATAPGQPTIGGISARRLVTFDIAR